MEIHPGAALAARFSEVPDPRINRRKLHSLTDIIGLSIIAVLGNAEGFEEIEDFGRSKVEWLRTFLDLRNGIPSHDTISRVFQRIDPVAFERCFLGWVATLQQAHGGEVIAIDGKCLRG